MFGFFAGSRQLRDDEVESAALVDKFVTRLETSTSVDDQRDALKGLRSMAKRERLAVTTRGMNAYIELLSDHTYPDIVATILDLLNAVLTDDAEGAEHDDIGERLAETLLRKKTFVPSLVKLFELDHFTVRRNAVALMTSLLRHRLSEVQQLVMMEAQGISSIVDMLHDKREAIRNSILLMLSELSKGNVELQKMLAYQDTFRLLFDIIQLEPMDSIIVEDCLFVMLNLLKRNPPNQETFREARYLKELTLLCTMFVYPPNLDEQFAIGQMPDEEWDKQKCTNFIFMMQIVRALVSPNDNVHNAVHASQKSFLQSGMLELLCKVLMAQIGISVDSLTEAIIAVAECIRGNYANQEFFAASTYVDHSLNEEEAPIKQPALLILLISMTEDNQPFRLRSAVFYCFICYLFDNEKGKIRIIETLLHNIDRNSSPNYEAQLQIGQYLCGAVLNYADPAQVWFGTVCLMHTLLDASHLKPMLCRVQISTSENDQPSSLLSHLTKSLIQSSPRRVQQRYCFLMLFIVWLYECSPAIDAFMSNDDVAHYMISQLVDQHTEVTEAEGQLIKGLVAFLVTICMHCWEPDLAEKKTAFTELVVRRIGLDRVAEHLESVTKSELYVRAAKHTHPSAKTSNELYLEFQFARMLKSLEGELLKVLRPNGDPSNASLNENVIQSYKKLIKKQDEEIAELKQELRRMKFDEEQQTKCNGVTSVQDYDQGLRNGPLNDSTSDSFNRPNAVLLEELAHLRAQLQQENAAKNEENSELAILRMQYQQLGVTSQHWQAEAERCKQWAMDWQAYQIAQLPNPQESAIAQLHSQLQQLDQQFQYGWQAYEDQARQLAEASIQNEKNAARIKELEQNLAESFFHSQAMKENDLSAKQELDSLQKEHNDLLLAFSDQYNKLKRYKNKLRTKGEAVSDDEDEC